MIEIHFRRSPAQAWCEIDGRRLEVPPPKRGTGGGAIYRIVAMLARAGYEGRPFTAHDGRMVCLRGKVRLDAVPKEYRGAPGGCASPQRAPAPSEASEAA